MVIVMIELIICLFRERLIQFSKRSFYLFYKAYLY